jgi:hypothetical protein
MREQVVLQVPAHLGQVDDRLDAQGCQVPCLADARVL